MNQEKMTQRLETLRNEYQEGQKVKQELINKLDNINATLLRISGAIQILEELDDSTSQAPDASPDALASATTKVADTHANESSKRGSKA